MGNMLRAGLDGSDGKIKLFKVNELGQRKWVNQAEYEGIRRCLGLTTSEDLRVSVGKIGVDCVTLLSNMQYVLKYRKKAVKWGRRAKEAVIRGEEGFAFEAAHYAAQDARIVIAELERLRDAFVSWELKG